MKPQIIPSIIAKNQKELDKRIAKVAKGTEWLQLDVMDGKFVRNKSLVFDFSLPKTKCKYEAHLMTNKPLSWIEKNSGKVDTIIIHREAFSKKAELDKMIKLIVSKGVKVGLAIGPKTDIKVFKGFLDELDLVLFMTVNPGKYGARFLPRVLGKIKKFVLEYKFTGDIEVDGGIDEKTIHAALRAGANRFVVGSDLQNAKDVEGEEEKLKILIQ